MKQVHKFGGASIASAEQLIQTASIIEQLPQREQCTVIVSARGKTTNALEEILHLYLQRDSLALTKLEELKRDHLHWMQSIFSGGVPGDLDDAINNLFVEIEWAIEDEPRDDYGFEYDQIVSMGELISSAVLSGYLRERGVPHALVDARDWLKTDNRYRNARILWPETMQAASQVLRADHLIISQGFIGCTSENFTTTLGREGSDYTAAIAAKCLEASSVTVWKDVPGIMTADPKQNPDASFISHLNYREAIELAYYGAKVIHPKTLHPLIETKIPLVVRSFVQPELSGTTIDATEANPPESVIQKEGQFLVSLRKNTLGFVDDAMLTQVLTELQELGLESRMLHQSAVTLSIVMNDPGPQKEHLLNRLRNTYRVTYNENLELITIRHGGPETQARWGEKPGVLLEQATRDTFQILLKPTPSRE